MVTVRDGANEDWLIYLRLSKAGYGDPLDIQKWNVCQVMNALHYEAFLSDYDWAYIELNKETPS